MSFVNPFLKSFFCYWEGEDKKKKTRRNLLLCVDVECNYISFGTKKRKENAIVFEI